ncbi:FMI1 protein [Metarhizium album ARSEF 1941]|uniref:Altered inheritance of mitochondria protein 32 n=1 Tax=Metarhizium album (strain ARSEF 1941) TaxID=1081103 RepID=A0A0B2WW06_METAS|nr:FMI1 protein [Metarhizium album ARSEF 1941]KHO00352.1 FMI1 protein [Metarhizium album ARSEF 1941]
MPKGFDIDFKSNLNGAIPGYAEQVLVCTGRDDWPSRIEDEFDGDNLAADLKELFGRGGRYSDPFHHISVVNSSFPSSVPPRPELHCTSAYLLPSFKYIPFLPRISFDSVEALAKGFLLPEKLHSAHDGLSPIHRDRLTRKAAYQGLLPGVRDVGDVLVLICGHGGRDARCGIMGPVLRDEFEEKLAREDFNVLTSPVEVDLTIGDAAGMEGAVPRKNVARVGLISHIGGHKFAGNVIVYIPPGHEVRGGGPHPLAGCGICQSYASVPARSKRCHHTTHAHREARVLASTLIGIGLIGTASYYVLAPTSHKSLNRDTFIPYTITSRQPISPTSVVFTVSPHGSDPSLPYLLPNSKTSKYPLWSVEFKQPEVQIARHYTPLPPTDGENTEDGSLSFYLRAVGGGEMSNYLNKLSVGQDVYLRGPHAGFDVLQRLGEQKNVVFLAGGTGVVPGMQVATAVLERGTASSVKLLWAVRRREELQRCCGQSSATPWWKFFSAAAPIELSAEVEQPSAMGKRLAQMKAKYGERLSIRVAVDEERVKFTEKDMEDALAAGGPTLSSPGCQLHDQRLHVQASEFEELSAECHCAAGNDSGKNLLMVSGPAGFVAHYAGDKAWLGGVLTQGAVGGVAGMLQRRNPTLANDWLVLKL